MNNSEELIEVMKELCSVVRELNKNLKGMNSAQSEPKADKSKDDLSKWLEIATHKGYSDEQFIDALKSISKLKFKISNKQVAWITYWSAINHKFCEKETGAWLMTELNKDRNFEADKNEVIEVLKSTYTNKSNEEYINNIVNWIIGICADKYFEGK